MVEYMVVPTMAAKFNELGYIFTKANPDTVIRDHEPRAWQRKGGCAKPGRIRI